MNQNPIIQPSNLELENYILRLQNAFLIRGIAGINETAIEEFQRQQERIRLLESVVDEFHPKIAEPTVDDKVAKALIEQKIRVMEWGETCAVEARVWLRYGSEPEDLDVCYFDPVLFPGTREKAKLELTGMILAALGRTPTKADIKDQTVPGLTSDELLDICKWLTPYWYQNKDKKEYEKERLSIYKQYQNQLERGSYRDKNRTHTNFNNVITRTFENAEKRLK